MFISSFFILKGLQNTKKVFYCYGRKTHEVIHAKSKYKSHGSR